MPRALKGLHRKFSVGSHAVYGVDSRQATHNSAGTFCNATQPRAVYFSSRPQAGIKRQCVIWVSTIRHMYRSLAHAGIIKNIHCCYVSDRTWYSHRSMMPELRIVRNISVRGLEPEKRKGFQTKTNAAKNRGMLPLLSNLAGDESLGWHPLIEDFITVGRKLEQLDFAYHRGHVLIVESG